MILQLLSKGITPTVFNCRYLMSMTGGAFWSIDVDLLLRYMWLKLDTLNMNSIKLSCLIPHSICNYPLHSFFSNYHSTLDFLFFFDK